MSSRGSNNGGGVAMIPSGSRKIVESLKEIVRNYPESEIYAALKECNMDPNEAVNRLLSQDPFHEVKSKRDKRKENKDTTESRPRGASSSRGGKGSADRYAGRGGSESLHGKSTYAYKENGYTNTKSTRTAGSTTNRRLPTISDAAGTENQKFVDGVSAATQHSSGYQPAWGGVPGQVSMADIVKMGKPHGKAPNGTSESWQNVNASYNHAQGPSGALEHNWQFSGDHTSKASEVYLEAGVSPAQPDSTNDEWPLIEQPSTACDPSISDPPSSQVHPDSSHAAFNKTNQHPQTYEVQGAEDHGIDSVGTGPVVSGSLPNGELLEDNSAAASSLHDSGLDTYPLHNHGFDGDDDEDTDASVSLAAANLQQLSIEEEQDVAPERDGPAVVIPDHLQVQAADCSHLSFGSFGSGISATLSGALASAPPTNTDVEEESKDADAPPVGHLTNGSSEYYGDEDLRNEQDGILFHRTGAISGNYESPSDTQPDSLKVEHAEVAHGNQYSFPSSAPGYTYENAQQLNVVFSQSQTSSQTQNLAPFSNVMGYSNSLPSNLLTTNVHAGRESDLSYSPFSTQAMPAKYGNSVSSVGGSSISMPEALKTAGFSSTQPTQQTLTGTNVATGPALPQHLAVHPYSQPTLPLGPFANIISYPFMHQSYTYMPPGFQQPFAGNSTYQQSLAAVLPNYKNSVSVSSLPHSATVASGYGAFGNTGTIPGSFPLNPSAAPSTSLGIDDGLSSQYKDNHLMSLQQASCSFLACMWLHGHGSRTMSAAPANTYYNIQGQNQQPSGFRQVQQPSQNYASLGYNPNFYHSQTGISLDHHQQQNPRDGPLGGNAQVQPKPSSQQLWQNGY
nr:uncharacterized protein LOC109165618 isoform X2 [Ipomoea batatas]